MHTTHSTDLKTNRGLLFGDSVFETLRVKNNKVLLAEDHYLRLMATMRICRMEIPMNFTLEFFCDEILKHITTEAIYRVRITVYRDSEGLYTPENNKIAYFIDVKELEKDYDVVSKPYEVELYKDFHISKHLLSTIKTNNKMVNVLAGVFAKDYGFDNCLLINEEKNVVEAINGNLFMLMDNQWITPPLSDGCLNGIIRKKISSLREINGKPILEKSISPFDLQKADALFITNVVSGILPVTKYRKKNYNTEYAVPIIDELNKIINSN
jgi:branched-chain amino acid aminotransferase